MTDNKITTNVKPKEATQSNFGAHPMFRLPPIAQDKPAVPATLPTFAPSLGSK